MTSQNTSLFTDTLKLALPAQAGRFVTSDGIVADSSMIPWGVTRCSGAVGNSVPVDRLGTAMVESGGIFASGDFVGIDAQGRAVLWTAGIKAGRAMEASGAAGQITEISIFDNPIGMPIGGSKQWRGIGQGMSLAVQNFAGGSAWSMTHRTRHYSNVRFRRVRAVLQTFYMTGTPIVDTNFADDYNFQVGFEQGYTPALTGIAPRKMFTFGGTTIASYLAASPPSDGYIVSDILDLGSYVESDEFYGLWTTVEAAARTGSNKIPYTRNASNFLQKYIGTISAAGVSQIDAGSAQLATSITSSTLNQWGASNYYSPCMLLIETDSGVPFVVCLGDSIAYGVGESVTGSGSYGDGVGSPLSNLGFVERGIHENLKYSVVNFSKGSDGNKYLATQENWAKRKKLLALANPTHVILQNVFNDIGPTITVSNIAVSTAYAKWNVGLAGGNLYICVKAGTTGGTAPTWNTSGGIVDGTAQWAYLMADPGTAFKRGAALVIAQMAAVTEQIAATVPGVPIIGNRPTVQSSSTDAWATTANQTTGQQFTPTNSRRWLAGQIIAARNYLLRLSAVIDTNQFIEDGYPSETGKWVANGSASYLTNEGTHPNSVGHAVMAAAITADLFNPL